MTIHLPAKRKKEPMGVRPQEKRESNRHRKFVRSFVCAVFHTGAGCEGAVQCAHIRDGLPRGEQAGMAQKTHDMWTVPLCERHHAEYDNAINGSWKTFEKKYRVDLQKIAVRLARESKCPIVREKVKQLDAAGCARGGD